MKLGKKSKRQLTLNGKKKTKEERERKEGDKKKREENYNTEKA